MQDSYKVLLREINSIELIDKEVDWIDYYRQTNSFCKVKPVNEHYRFSIVKFNSLKEQFENFYYCATQADPSTYLTVKPHVMDLWRFSCILKNRVVEYNNWKEKKIKIKGVLLKNESISGYVKYLKNLENEVVDEFGSIDKDDFEYLKIRRTELHNVVLSLMKVSNKFGIDHEALGGTRITNLDNIEKKEAKYRNKFKIADLWSILEAEHFELKNGGLMQPKYDYVNPYFENKQGERVYVTVDFLSDFQSVFQRRRETLDNIIKRLDFKFKDEKEIIIQELESVNMTIGKHQKLAKRYDLENDKIKLAKIFNDDMIDCFLKNEKRLKADGYITSENKWINGRGKNRTKTLKDLANLILLLNEKKYLKLKLDRKQLKYRDYKLFFEDRYGCNLKEQLNDAKNNEPKSLETAKTTFPYFYNP